MGKACGRKRRLKKKFRYNVDRKKLLKQQRKLPVILCPEIRAEWDRKSSVRKNLESMGLAVNANKALSIPTTEDVIRRKMKRKTERKDSVSEKGHVVRELEAQATAPQPQRLRVSNEHCRFAIYMMEKYDEDYEAMARDPRNHYQQTPNQIRRKIYEFKRIPAQYNEYLKSKMDTTPVN